MRDSPGDLGGVPVLVQLRRARNSELALLGGIIVLNVNSPPPSLMTSERIDLTSVMKLLTLRLKYSSIANNVSNRWTNRKGFEAVPPGSRPSQTNSQARNPGTNIGLNLDFYNTRLRKFIGGGKV